MSNLNHKKTGSQPSKIETACLHYLSIKNSSDDDKPISSVLLQPQLNAALTVEQALMAGCFPPKLTTGIRYLIAHCPTVRKTAEMATHGIPYLPSFLQRANPLLRFYCRQQICSRALGDGTGRVEYYFCPYVEEVAND